MFKGNNKIYLKQENLIIKYRSYFNDFVFFDIGAYLTVGYKNLYQKFLDDGNVDFFCFEPTPSGFRSLNDNFGEKCKMNIFNYAIGSKNEYGNLRIVQDNPYLSTFKRIEDVSVKKIKDINSGMVKSIHKKRVLIKKLDDVVSGLGLKRIDLIKIDVEGWELEVLSGAKDTIEKYRPVFIVEFHMGVDFDEIINKYFNNYNYIGIYKDIEDNIKNLECKKYYLFFHNSNNRFDEFYEDR